MTDRIRIQDPALFALALVPSLAGIFFIFDAGYARSLSEWRGWLPAECRTQLVWLIVAVAVALLCGRVRPQTWRQWSFGFGAVVLLLLVLVKVAGHRMNGAQRWIGAGPISIQPAELAKLATVLYLAAVFAERPRWPRKIPARRDWVHRFESVWIPKLKRCIPGAVILAVIVLIEVEPDLGTAAVVAVTAFAMFLPGGVSRRSLAFGLALAMVFGWAMVHKEAYRLERFTHHSARWTNANVDSTEYQTVQSELAQADGGVLGVGLGAGRAKHVLPATTTDFIMATIGEETGLVGSIAVLGLLGALVWRLSWLAQQAKTRYQMLVLYGVGAWIGIQACVNVMMANAFLPAIGIPLPFISSGGSSLVALWAAIGICQSMAGVERSGEKASREDLSESGDNGWRHRRSRLSRA